MPFKPGDKPGPGRTKGIPNLIGQEGKAIMDNFFAKEFKKLAEKFDDSKISDYQRWMILLQIAKYIYPTLKSQQIELDVDAMTDNMKGEIIGEFIKLYGKF